MSPWHNVPGAGSFCVSRYASTASVTHWEDPYDVCPQLSLDSSLLFGCRRAAATAPS